MKKKSMIILFVLVSLISCAKQKVQTDINVDLSQFATGSYPNGLILYGSSNTGDSIVRVLNDNALSTELTAGIWNFHVMGWDDSAASNDPFKGAVKCGRALNVDLISGNQSIDITLDNSAVACDDYGNFNGTNFSNPTMLIKNSNGGVCDLVSGNNCVTDSAVMGVKISVISLNYFNGNLTQLSGPIESVCISPGSFDTAFTTFPVKGFNGFALGAIELYTDSGCTSSTGKKTRFIGGAGTFYDEPVSTLKVLY